MGWHWPFASASYDALHECNEGPIGEHQRPICREDA